MPYIEDDRRFAALSEPRTPQELTYAIAMLLQYYVRKKGLLPTYIGDCLGALEGAKLEFFRRVVVPAEERLRKQHGDMFYMDGSATPFPDPEDDDPEGFWKADWKAVDENL